MRIASPSARSTIAVSTTSSANTAPAVAVTSADTGTNGAASEPPGVAATIAALMFMFMLAGLVLLVLRWFFRLITGQKNRLAREEAERQRRWAELVASFGDPIARRIWIGELYQGDSAEVVKAMFGPPAAIDENVMKTKIKHTYKYDQTSAKRFGLKIFLEDGKVVGWER